MKATPQTAPPVELIDRVRVALVEVAGVKEKKMFGSVAFLVRGKMCVSARAERIMCRIEPSRHDAAVQREGCRTVVMRGRPYRGYVYVDAAVVRTGRALKYWIKLALDYREAHAEVKRRNQAPPPTAARGRALRKRQPKKRRLAGDHD